MSAKYKRVLLKLSGEQLAGRYDHGIDPKLASWVAKEVKGVQDAGVEVVIMIGGGNFVRGAQIAGHGIKRVTADHMGMLGTMINALGLTDIFEEQGIWTRCLSNIFAEQVAEPFSHRLASKHLKKKRVVIVAGGIGRPYLTTDTAAISLALELDCSVVLKATAVGGVYDKDPAKNKDAVLQKNVNFQKAVEDNDIMVMDKAALGLAMEHNMNIIIFNAMKPGSLLSAIDGKNVGTIIQ